MSRHAVRVMAVILGCMIYLPATVLMVIQVGGPVELQAMIDWLTGHCGADCSGKGALITAIQIAPIVLTAPILVLVAIIWVIRGRRSDRAVSAIISRLDGAPERISPHAVDAGDDDRYLYRDRRGSLRPVYAPQASPQADDPGPGDGPDRFSR